MVDRNRLSAERAELDGPFDDYLKSHRRKLLDLAERAIDYGLTENRVLPVQLSEFPAPLTRMGACFVTLKKDGALRGCVGSLTADYPLVNDIVANAYRAAFEDPRFEPLNTEERWAISCSLSILTEPEEIRFSSEANLLARLEPRRDGLIIRSAMGCATFLPQVWEQLPEPDDFLLYLKRKAGFRDDFWPQDCRAWRYEVVEIE